MLLLDQAAGTARTSPDAKLTPDPASSTTPTGRPIVIILDRDGTLRHYPPARSLREPRHAQLALDESQAQPNLIDRIIHVAFDVLGVDRLELRVYEHAER